MKKKLLILFVTAIVTFFSCSIRTKNKNDLSILNLKGKVKSLTETEFKAEDKFGDIQSRDIQSKENTSFNEKGNMIEENIYKSDGSLNQKNINKFDDKGLNTGMVIYNQDGSLSSKWLYKNDDNGNIIEENAYNSNDSLISKITYKYNNKGNIIEESLLPFGKYKGLGAKWIYKYDDKGNRIEENDSLNTKCINKFDDKGNEIENDIYNSDGSLNKKINYKYNFDATGNWIKKIYFLNDTPQTITEREIVYY